MEQALFNLYLKVLGEISESKGTFHVQARMLMRELLDPSTDARERFEWIEHAPADQFEKYLKISTNRRRH